MNYDDYLNDHVAMNHEAYDSLEEVDIDDYESGFDAYHNGDFEDDPFEAQIERADRILDQIKEGQI